MERIAAPERTGQDRAAATSAADADAFPCDLVAVLARTLAQANHFLVREMAEAGMGNLATSHGDILSELFEEIGALVGQGDGSTTFNLPDLRGKWMMGADAERAAASAPSSALYLMPFTTLFAAIRPSDTSGSCSKEEEKVILFPTSNSPSFPER